MTPWEFCAGIRAEELRAASPDDPWARGALALCDWYAKTDAERFESILRSMARGSQGSTAAEGARWLLSRWEAAQRRGSSEALAGG